MHAHEKGFPNIPYCVCLVVTKQDLKFEPYPFMDSEDIVFVWFGLNLNKIRSWTVDVLNVRVNSLCACTHIPNVFRAHLIVFVHASAHCNETDGSL